MTLICVLLLSFKFAYPCIGALTFLDIEINRTPCYDEIKQRIAAGENYLEVGCCFAQELRKLVIDGAPPENLYGTDLDLSFVELGYELFRDKDRLKSQFIAADILAPDSAVDALRGQMSIINAGYFFHLFSWEDQLTAGKRLVGLLSKENGNKGLITGRHVAGEIFEKMGWMDSDLYLHSIESWNKLWEEIGEATGTEWAVSVTRDPLAKRSKVQTERKYYVMMFVCRQI